jgi:beta-glucanase (GH16 family)
VRFPSRVRSFATFAGTLAATALVAAAPADGAPKSSWRITAGGHPIYDAAGHVWNPGAGLRGGRRERVSITPRHTVSPDLYRVRRAGITSATIDVGRPGTYAVVVSIAEDGDVPVGRPLFDVRAAGRVAGTFVARTPNAGLPSQVVFTTPVKGRHLRLTFHRGDVDPQVSAIEVRRMSSETRRARLRWHDEFDGAAGTPVDRRRWAFDLGVGGSPGWGNQELQTYTDRPENIGLDGSGNLAITARRETLAYGDGAVRDYTSARIKTKGLYAFTYGEIAFRARMPQGPGIWPSLWAVGENVFTVGWPKSGEIDVVEVLHSDQGLAWGSLHGPKPDGTPWAISRQATLAPLAHEGFHVYSALWVPGAIQMRLDGKPYWTYTPQDLGRDRVWVFDHPFHLIMNVAVGGVNAGALTPATPFPTTMLVDWVRVTR